jgi:hypothetical protein
MNTNSNGKIGQGRETTRHLVAYNTMPKGKILPGGTVKDTKRHHTEFLKIMNDTLKSNFDMARARAVTGGACGHSGWRVADRNGRVARVHLESSPRDTRLPTASRRYSRQTVCATSVLRGLGQIESVAFAEAGEDSRCIQSPVLPKATLNHMRKALPFHFVACLKLRLIHD